MRPNLITTSKMICIVAFLALCEGAFGADSVTSGGRSNGAPPPELLPQLLETYDANKNGLFDPEERAVWRRDQARKPSGAPRRWDKNGDGVIDAAERADARAWFKGQGTSDATTPVSTNAPAISSVERKRLRDQLNQELVSRFDKNGDGELDNAERDALWTEYKAKVRAKQAEQTKPAEP